MLELQGLNILPKIMIGSLVSLCLFLYNPLITFAQAPPEDIGALPEAPPKDIAPPSSLVGPPINLTAPPSEIAPGIAPSELASSGCQSYIYDATIDGNVSSINASALNNRSNEFGTSVYDPRFTLTTTLIAKDLSNLSPTDIKDYDLKDLSTDEMKSVLCMLTPGNLTKVLTNIPVEDLLYLMDKLTPQTFLNILRILPAENSTQIINRTTEIGP